MAKWPTLASYMERMAAVRRQGDAGGRSQGQGELKSALISGPAWQTASRAVSFLQQALE